MKLAPLPFVACIALLSACGGAPHAQSTLAAPTSIPPEDLDPRFEHEDAVALAQFDRLTGYREDTAAVAVEPTAPPAAQAESGEEVRTASTASESEDRCDQVRVYQRDICSLAERICSIAGAHPEFADIAARCSDGRSRCSGATASADRCED